MEVANLSAEFRPSTGKTVARRLRANGMIPAVCYGEGAQPLTLAVNPVALVRALDPVKKTNTVLKLTVTGAPDGQSELTVMLRDYQKDPLRGEVTHADFIRVSLDRDVHAIVPVTLTGKAEGVKLGGIMHQVLRSIEVAAKPHLIPASIEVDVTPLNMGEAIHVSDLKLAEGVRPLTDGASTICSVTAPRAEKEGAAGAPAEGAAAAGAAAAAPAAGGEKKAAAPAKDEKKK